MSNVTEAQQPWKAETVLRNAAIDEAITRYGLTFHYVHVPFLQTETWKERQAAGRKTRTEVKPIWEDFHPEFDVELRRADREIARFNYRDAHVCTKWEKPHYGRVTVDEYNAALYEVRFGRRKSGYVLRPEDRNVLYCVISDADVLNYRDFEDWADCMGYDSDSRKQERIYQACMKIALSLRNGLGEAGLAEFQRLYEGY